MDLMCVTGSQRSDSILTTHGRLASSPAPRGNLYGRQNPSGRPLFAVPRAQVAISGRVTGDTCPFDWSATRCVACEPQRAVPPSGRHTPLFFSAGGRRRPQRNPSYARVRVWRGNQHGTTFLELLEKSERNFCTSNISGRHCNLRFVPRDPDALNHFARSSLRTPKCDPDQKNDN